MGNREEVALPADGWGGVMDAKEKLTILAELSVMLPSYEEIGRKLSPTSKHPAPGVSKRRAKRKAQKAAKKRNRG